MGEGLRMWTIYCNPSDLPGRYVVRPFLVTSDGPVPERRAWGASSLEGARAVIPPGCTRLGRHPTDDPVIVETWL